MTTPTAVLSTDPAARAAAVRLRLEVFVDEQNVPAEEEIDGRDDDAEHAVVLEGDGPEPDAVATARLLIVQGVGIVGRVAVRRDRRRQGLGAEVMRVIEGRAHELGLPLLELHAQRVAEAFYASLGYIAYGEPYLEANIEHISMRKVLNPA